MLLVKSFELFYHRVKINKYYLIALIVVFWTISLLNIILFPRDHNKPLQLLNVFLNFQSERFVSFGYLPLCFITTVIILHNSDNLFLLVRFKEIYYYLKVQVIQLLIVTTTCTLSAMLIFFFNIGIYSIYFHSSLDIDFYSLTSIILNFLTVFFINTLNILLLQTIFYIFFKSRLLGFICMFLLVLIDPFLNMKTGVSVILYHGMVINNINITISELINQYIYCLGEFFLLLVVFYYSYDKKEFY